MTYNKKTVDIVDAVSTLRDALETSGKLEDLKIVMRHLFKGNASVEADNQGQLVVYTGYTYGAHTEYVMTMENEPEGFPQFWCKND